ncbi:aberrant root formation protein 4-like [Silene latifolia]|uniref:aberrant root formation protein 4-like n=1 Tax=Silene latifolia TaxID=37657 RepID=UPI003D77CB87
MVPWWSDLMFAGVLGYGGDRTTLELVLANIPASPRLDMMQFLVRNSSSASMMAILLDFVRENLRNDDLKLKEAKIRTTNSFWNAAILDLVEFILRPP